jgi:hypothetical protein
MNRRTLLRTAGVGVAAVAGCLETATDAADDLGDRTTDGTTTRTTETTRTMTDECPESAIQSDRVHAHSDYGHGIVREGVERPAVAIVGEDWRSELRTDEMSAEDEAFVTGTDFDQSFLLVVQFTKSSSGDELRITDYWIDDETLRADLCLAGTKDISPDDAPTTNLFARIDHSGEVPTTVEARIETPSETITVSGE